MYKYSTKKVELIYCPAVPIADNPGSLAVNYMNYVHMFKILCSSEQYFPIPSFQFQFVYCDIENSV